MMVTVGDPVTALADCTAFQIDILLIIGDTGGENGANIRRALNDRHGFTSGRRLYPNLDSLVEEGYIEKGPAEDGRANQYRLTDAGRHQVAAYVEYVYTRGGDV